MRDLVDRRCELLYENFAGLVYCNHSEQKYMHKARFPCIQVLTSCPVLSYRNKATLL